MQINAFSPILPKMCENERFFLKMNRLLYRAGNQMWVPILYLIMKVKFFLNFREKSTWVQWPHLGFNNDDPLCNFSLILFITLKLEIGPRILKKKKSDWNFQFWIVRKFPPKPHWSFFLISSCLNNLSIYFVIRCPRIRKGDTCKIFYFKW